jgi:Rieske 2Fe-2S family protein
LQRTLPGDFYRSEEIFGQERERIFWREWFCAGREEALPSPGDYLSVEVAGQSVLVVRDRAGGLGAFYNVCRHRGSQLVIIDEGGDVLPEPFPRAGSRDRSCVRITRGRMGSTAPCGSRPS